MSDFRNIPKRIRDEADLLSKFLEDENDWLVLKKILLKMLPPKLRTNFSTRDPKTKRQSLNSFEKQLIDYWELKTGNRLVLYPDE